MHFRWGDRVDQVNQVTQFISTMLRMLSAEQCNSIRSGHLTHFTRFILWNTVKISLKSLQQPDRTEFHWPEERVSPIFCSVASIHDPTRGCLAVEQLQDLRHSNAVTPQSCRQNAVNTNKIVLTSFQSRGRRQIQPPFCSTKLGGCAMKCTRSLWDAHLKEDHYLN